MITASKSITKIILSMKNMTWNMFFHGLEIHFWCRYEVGLNKLLIRNHLHMRSEKIKIHKNLWYMPTLDIMLASLISKLGDFKCLLVDKVEKDNLLDIVEDIMVFIYDKFRNNFYKYNHCNILIINWFLEMVGTLLVFPLCFPSSKWIECW